MAAAPPAETDSTTATARHYPRHDAGGQIGDAQTGDARALAPYNLSLPQSFVAPSVAAEAAANLTAVRRQVNGRQPANARGQHADQGRQPKGRSPAVWTGCRSTNCRKSAIIAGR